MQVSSPITTLPAPAATVPAAPAPMPENLIVPGWSHENMIFEVPGNKK